MYIVYNRQYWCVDGLIQDDLPAAVRRWSDSPMEVHELYAAPLTHDSNSLLVAGSKDMAPFEPAVVHVRCVYLDVYANPALVT